MRHTGTPFVLAVLPALIRTSLTQSTSPKRGLIYIPSQKHPQDDQIWIRENSDLTWYYNYAVQPQAAYKNDTSFEFVPMLWGASDADTSNTYFLDNVTAMIDAGQDIKYVLSFNEPDGPKSTGGSNLDADLAAKVWKKQIEPLRSKHGVKLGAPAVTGSPVGSKWLEDFFDECDGECTVDFIPIHWYGNFDGFASHVGSVISNYSKDVSEFWVTEFGMMHEALNETQAFFNSSIKMLDDWSNITRYSYFGSFRSDASNIGPNAAMLTQKGELTDIGSWYLGGVATNNVPEGAAPRSMSSGFVGWMGLVGVVGLVLVL